MIRARIVGRRVLCGREGCRSEDEARALLGESAILGHLDDWRSTGRVLGLSMAWHLDKAATPPRWRMGKHARRFSQYPYMGSTRRLGSESGATIIMDPQAHAAIWRVPLPAMIECHRCRAVQEVAAE